VIPLEGLPKSYSTPPKRAISAPPRGEDAGTVSALSSEPPPTGAPKP
jgi:hypothetical protein